MITVPELASEALGEFLAEHLRRRFAATHAGLTELIPSVARLAIECIGNSDALYHNVEHTMLVTLVGYDIMKGRALLDADLSDRFRPRRWWPACCTTSVMCAASSKTTVPTAM